MSTPLSDAEISIVRVYQKRVIKTLKIENISMLKTSGGIAIDIPIDKNTYVLNIGINNNPNTACICVTVQHHKDNLNREVEFKVTLMDNKGFKIFLKSDTIKPNSPLLMLTKYSVRDLPSGCLVVRYELSCICWKEEKNETQTKKPVSFSRIENLSRDFGQLFSQRTNTDVMIHVEKSEIPVHSQILSARSEVFSAMFEHDMSERRDKIIQISDIGALAMHYFLIYIYTGKLEEMKNLRHDTLRQLYSAADKYAVAELKEMCSDFLLSNMSLDYLGSCAELGFRHSDKRMQDAVIDFVSGHMQTLDSRQWRELEESAPSVAAEVLSIICTKGQVH